MDQNIHSPKQHRTLFAVLLIVGFLAIAGILLNVIQKKVDLKTTRQNQPTPQVSTDSTLFPPHYVKRNYDPTTTDPLKKLPNQIQQTLSALPDNELVGIRCSMQLQNEWGTFYLRAGETHALTKKVDDRYYNSLLEQTLSSTAEPRKVLTARTCETDHGKVLIEFTEGEQPRPHPDESTDAHEYVAYFNYGESLPTAIDVLRRDYWRYPGCNVPYALTTSDIVYYSCNFPSELGSETKYLKLDLTAKKSELLLICTDNFAQGKRVTTCN
jgi:hypothetical protein